MKIGLSRTGALLALSFMAAMPIARAAPRRIVRLYNWADYIAPSVLDEFTRATGVTVVYDTFSSNRMLERKLLARHSGFDVVVPSAPFLAREIQAGVLRKLDRSKLSNWSNLRPGIMRRLAVFDPGNRYAVNYLWSTTGIAYNEAEAVRRLHGARLDSWDVLFKPQLVRKFANCGVDMLNDPDVAISSALRFLRLNPNSRSAYEIRRAADAIARIKVHLNRFRSSRYISALANGDICLALGRSYGALQARHMARAVSNRVTVDYVIPREGSAMSLDNLAVPVDAPHQAEALQLINFLMRPDIAAQNTNATGLANPIAASQPLIKKGLRDNPAIFPDESLMRRLFVVSNRSPALQRLVESEWRLLRRGR